MNVAIFHELPPGGARRSINAFAKELKKNNSVDLYLVDEQLEKNELQHYTSIKLYKFVPKTWRGKDWRTRIYKDTLELFWIYRLHKKIASVIDTYSYDVVLVSASKFIEAPFIMRFLKTPFIFYCQDPYYRIVYEPLFGIPKNIGLIRFWYERINRLMRKMHDKQNVSYAKRCVSPSKFIAQKFTKTYRKKNQVCYYGVDSGFFCPSNVKKEFDIFYIGSREAVDGYALLEESVRLMKKTPIVKAIFTEEEWISDDRVIRNLYRKSKIFFASAINEGLGASLMEAMSCGIPVIAVDEAGHKEIVLDGKTGYLVPRDPKKVASVLEDLFSSPKEISYLSKGARSYMVSEWSWEKRTAYLEKVLAQEIHDVVS